MRYHIDTIPVWDAFRKDSECPLCDLRAANEQSYLTSFLGASVMEPAVRIEVNQKGFCARHLSMMLPMQNRLGLALMTHTHLKARIAAMPAAFSGLKNRFGRKKAAPANEETCILCERLNATMDRYYYTTLHLVKTDKDFRNTFEASKGMCHPHFQSLCRMAEAEFGPSDAGVMIDLLLKLQRENLARIEKELEWFTLKFDYRNQDKPWGNSRDALERALVKLRGRESTEGNGKNG